MTLVTRHLVRVSLGVGLLAMLTKDNAGAETVITYIESAITPLSGRCHINPYNPFTVIARVTAALAKYGPQRSIVIIKKYSSHPRPPGHQITLTPRASIASAGILTVGLAGLPNLITRLNSPRSIILKIVRVDTFKIRAVSSIVNIFSAVIRFNILPLLSSGLVTPPLGFYLLPFVGASTITIVSWSLVYFTRLRPMTRPG